MAFEFGIEKSIGKNIRRIARKQMEDMPGVAAIIGKPIDTANLILAVARAPVRDRKADRIVL